MNFPFLFFSESALAMLSLSASAVSGSSASIGLTGCLTAPARVSHATWTFWDSDPAVICRVRSLENDSCDHAHALSRNGFMFPNGSRS